MHPPSILNYLREQQQNSANVKRSRTTEDFINEKKFSTNNTEHMSCRGLNLYRGRARRGHSTTSHSTFNTSTNYAQRGGVAKSRGIPRPRILDTNVRRNNTHIFFPNDDTSDVLLIRESGSDALSAGSKETVIARLQVQAQMSHQQQRPVSNNNSAARAVQSAPIHLASSINTNNTSEIITLSDSEEEEEKRSKIDLSLNAAQGSSYEDLKLKMEKYNGKLAVVAASISSLTKERSNLMKKIQVCEDMLKYKGRSAADAEVEAVEPPSVTTIHRFQPSHSQKHHPALNVPSNITSNTNTAAASSSSGVTIAGLPQPSGKTKATVETVVLPAISAKQVPFNPFISGRSWKLQSCPEMQVLSSTKTSKIGKLSRKPRNLILYPLERFRQTEPTLKDLAIIPTVNGDIQLFDMKKQCEMSCILRQSVFTTEGWAEEVSWVSKDTLAISHHPPSKPTEGTVSEQGITLLRNCSVDRDGQLRYDVSQIARTPHSKMIMAIEHIQNSSGSSSNYQFVTGGADRSVQLWNVNDTLDIKSSTLPIVFEQLYNTHTSEVSCLYYDRTTAVLYSGGKDTRMIGFDFQSKQIVYGGKDMRTEYMIKEILPVSTDPKLLVIGGYQKINASSDFSIFDIRTQSHVLKITRGPSTGAYNRASIHQNGMLLTSGDISNSIHIWDLRYIKVNCEYQRIQNVHSKSVISTRFYERGIVPSVLLSVGSDNELLLTDYERGR